MYGYNRAEFFEKERRLDDLITDTLGILPSDIETPEVTPSRVDFAREALGYLCLVKRRDYEASEVETEAA